MGPNVWLALLLGLSGFALVGIGIWLWRLPVQSVTSADTDLLYALTHDVSNPLQGILATLANMSSYAPREDPNVELNWQQDRESIHAAVTHLADLTANFKALSLLDSTNIPDQRRLIDITGVAQTVIITMGTSAERNDVRLTYQGQDKSPLIWGNESDIERLLINLVHNGIKFRNKEIEQREVLLTIAHSNENVVVIVEDNGIGMSETRVAQIWDKPFQPRSARTIGIEGTGLGLYLVKQIIDKYGGEIQVDSFAGRGTKFTMQFPIARAV